jgi:hypothetical protein
MLSPDLGILGRRQAESPLSTLSKFPEPPLNTGYYTFSYIRDGETKTLPARYSLHLRQARRLDTDQLIAEGTRSLSSRTWTFFL